MLILIEKYYFLKLESTIINHPFINIFYIKEYHINIIYYDIYNMFFQFLLQILFNKFELMKFLYL